MKGVLKKISGVLKYAATAIPALLLAFGIGATVGGVVESANNTQTMKGFYASEPVQQVIQTELDELDNSVLNGEYTFTEAADKHNEIKSEDHLKEVTENVYKGDAQYEASVKAIARDYGLITSGLLSLSAGLFTGFLWYVDKDGIAEKLKDSAEIDFTDAKYMDSEMY